MSLCELYSKIMELLVDLTDIPEFIPFIGDIRWLVSDWVGNNPEAASELADKIYQLLVQYKGGIE